MKYLFTLMFLVLSSLGFTQSENYDVRSVRWGMTKEDVIKAEGTPTETATNLVRYTDVEMGKFSVAVTYSFINNQLNKVDIVVPNKSQSSSKSFNVLEAILKQQYGNPTEVTNIWATTNQKLRSDSSAAIIAGALARNSTRTNIRTTVYHTIYGVNGNTIHQLIYKPRVGIKAKLDNSSKR
ncbi:hypothetical protein [Spirosoma flavum]|uniref:Uncharacterized protein n=1 Tax=Spirosoma flavum TaxID=2048557 RepID=A0ABW6AIR1_9BACT